MKKIGIFAIGALLFVSVSCNKDKKQLEPTTNYNSVGQGPSKTDYQQGELLPAADYPLEENNPNFTREAGNVRPHNENAVPTTYNPNRVVPTGVGNNDVVNPNTNTGKIIKQPAPYYNENEYPTPHNDARNTRIGSRNDELINTNTSDL